MRYRKVFSKAFLQETAVKTGFYIRKGNLTPELFFDLLIYCASSSTAVSLEKASTCLHDNYGLLITKQSLDERFNASAVKFVKEVFRIILEKELSQIIYENLFPQFNYVRIKDSTRFNVPDRLSEQFKGSGGVKGVRKACVCIQYEYDLKSGKILDLNVTAGTINDATDANQTCTHITSNDIVITLKLLIHSYLFHQFFKLYYIISTNESILFSNTF